MAQHQAAQRRGEKQIAASVAKVDPRVPRVLNVQGISDEGLQAILKLIGGGLEDSSTLEVVNPSTGRFWHVEGVSLPGGTDDPRP